jgi:hypothetical protein
MDPAPSQTKTKAAKQPAIYVSHPAIAVPALAVNAGYSSAVIDE